MGETVSEEVGEMVVETVMVGEMEVVMAGWVEREVVVEHNGSIHHCSCISYNRHRRTAHHMRKPHRFRSRCSQITGVQNSSN